MQDLDGVFVDVSGSVAGESIVLVHGAPDRSTTFRGVVAQLADCRVVVYDRRGYGRSTGAAPPATLEDHAADLLSILASLQTPRVVVAHSFGSIPTMLAVTRRPELFAAVGLWEPPLVWIDSWPQRAKDYNATVAASTDPAATIEHVYRRLLREGWDRLAPAGRAERRAEGVAFQVDMASSLHAPFDVAEVVVPTIVGYGADTSAVNVDGVEWLAGHLPNAATYVIPEAGHFACRTHPEQYARFVRSVLALATV